MSILSGRSLLANRRTVSSAIAATLLSTAVVVAAVQADGSTATNVRLDDGAVWVTNQQEGLVGRLNVRIEELDFAVVSSRAADVLQETRPTGEAQPERTVLFTGKDGGVRQVDVVTAQQTGENEIPIVDYRIGGGIGAVLDPETGGLWVGSAQQVVAPDYPDEPDALVEPGSLLVVTSGGSPDDSGGRPDPGRVLIVDAGGWYEVELGDDLEPLREVSEEEADPDSSAPTVPDTIAEPADDDVEQAEPEPLKVAEVNPLGVDPADIVEVSAVGGEPVVLLADGTVVLSDGAQVVVPGEGHRLQQVGASASAVLVASDAGLFEVALSSGDVSKRTDASGTASAPVRIGPCVWGAWTGEKPMAYRSCNGADTDLIEIPGAEPDSELVWRVNQTNIALNSVGNGDVWADKDGTLAYVGNWSDVEPNADDSEDVRETTGESRIVVEKTCVEGGAEPPTAGDDQLGVRPRQTIIDLLNNDDDVNCEPIAIASVDPAQGDWGQLTIINNGQHVLYSPSDAMLAVAKERIKPFTFTYIVSDIGGNPSGPATATVSVKDYALGNSPPELRPKTGEGTREMRAVVEQGQSVSYNVVADWWDPDGDDLRLAAAIAQEAGQVSSTPDGLVRFDAPGVPAGVQSVDVSMSDGIDTATEVLEVSVKPVGSEIPPVTSTDFVTLVVGGTAVINPLENDSDPNQDTLSLRPLWTETEVPGYQAVPQGDSVEITALEPGVHALGYEANDGVDSTKGTIRLEIVAPGEVNSGPIAVPDQAKVRQDRVVNVDVLANDVDADGDLLALTDVEVSTSDPALGIVRATLVDRRMVQVQVIPGPNGEVPVGPFVVSYAVSDGREEERAAAGQSTDQSIAESLRSQGAVTVLVQPPSDDQPPISTNDTATVRSGDIVAVPVLRNDTDPDADPIELTAVDPVVAAKLEAAGEGVVWVEGRNVYFQGGIAGRYPINYTVEAGGRRASAELSVVVKDLPNPDAPNQPPSPPTIELRAIRNAEVRVPIPSYGIDPDGDAVVLLADLGLPEQAGNTVALDEENPDVVLYAAGANSGPRDSFTYTVRDRFGARATGTVDVVVLDDGGWAPQANDDVFRGRPGRTLSIPVTANDTSPQDRRLEIAELPFFDADGQPSASPQNPDAVRLLDQTDPDKRGRIEVQVPTDGVVLAEHYRISDSLNPASAFLRVTPDPEAPNLPPVAEEDEVSAKELNGATEATVDVLANDFDPDDAGARFELALPAKQNATIVSGQLVVPRKEFAQRVLYRITDADGATAVGVVRVPGLENQAPILSDVGRDASNRLIEAAAPQALTILLDDIVEDPDSDPDIALTDTELSSPELGEVTRLDDGTGFVYTPPAELSTSTTVSIGFEVTDRPDQTIEERSLPACNCLSALTVDLVIEAASAPIVVGQGAVEVPQLDEAVTYDLAPLTIDEQDDRLTYALDSSTFGGLDVTSNGAQVTLVSRRDGNSKLPVGSSIPIKYTVDDGTFDPVDNYFVVTMVATNKGQPAPASFSSIEAERSVPISTPNFVNAAFNPFAGDGRPLTLENPTVTGGATITCSPLGACTFTSNTVGTFAISYTLRDAVDQTAIGTFEIVVKGKPFAPGVPSVASVGDKVVNLTWTDADMQGGEFVSYQVTAVEAGLTQRFTSPSGQFTGLRNATTYTFTVAAENELGLGAVSARSTGATPDRVPDPPVALLFTKYNDRSLSIAWRPPSTAGDFSTITGYQVRIGGQVLDVPGGSTQLTVGLGGQGAPLSNGTDYAFEMRARNSAVTDNGWGAWSGLSAVTERPSRYPDPPRNVTGVNAGDGGTPRITVRWIAPVSDGGRALTQYEVCRVQDNNCQTVGASTLQATFTQSRNQTVSFTVVALNTDKNRNYSDPAQSPPVIVVGTPDAPVISGIASGDKQLVVTASTTNNSGCSSFTIEYSRNAGSTWQAGSTFTGLVNGTSYTIIARTRLASTCGTPGQTYPSLNSVGVSQTPYGPLVTPTMDAGVSGTTITWTWRTNRSDDGRPDWTASISGECAGTAVSNGGYARDFGYSSGTKNCAITVSAGGSSLSDDAPAGTGPPPSVTVYVGSESTCPENDFAGTPNFNTASITCGNAFTGAPGFIAAGTALVVSCQYAKTYGSYNPWLRIESGGPVGWYVAAGTTTGSYAGLRSCF